MNDKKPVPPALAQFALDKLTTKAPVKSLYVEVLRDEYEGMRERIAERDARIDGLKRAWNGRDARVTELERELAALKAKPSGVVTTLHDAVIEAFASYERFGADCYLENHPMIHASTLEELAEVARLNPCREQSVQRCQCCGYLVTESEHRGCLRSAAVAVPDGYVVVPVEPTEEMITAMEDAEAVVIRDWHDLPHGGKGRTVEIRELAVYRAAIAAAPPASHTEQSLDMVPAAQQKESE